MFLIGEERSAGKDRLTSTEHFQTNVPDSLPLTRIPPDAAFPEATTPSRLCHIGSCASRIRTTMNAKPLRRNFNQKGPLVGAVTLNPSKGLEFRSKTHAQRRRKRRCGRLA